MLPPFVPPAARAATESLPLITEFVRQPVGRSSDRFWKGENQLSTAVVGEEAGESHEVVHAADVGAVPQPALPSISDFLAAARPAPLSATSPSLEPEQTETTLVVPDAGMPRPSRGWAHVPDEVVELSDPETLPEPIEGIPVLTAIPIVNEYAVQMPEHHAPSVGEPVEAPSFDASGETDRADAAPTEAKWIDDERNAFDWQSLTGLAARQNEERRAEDEWSSTNWDQGTSSSAEQVASLLNQIVRRVRTGELKVDSARGMSAESALAATLAALLRSED